MLRRSNKTTLNCEWTTSRKRRLKLILLVIEFTPFWIATTNYERNTRQVDFPWGIAFRDQSMEKLVLFKAGIVKAIDNDSSNRHLWLPFLDSVQLNIRRNEMKEEFDPLHYQTILTRSL